VLALPARWYENMPIVVLEAFAAGLPVVATSLGGLPEMIQPDEDGLVVPPDDPRSLADALGHLVGSPEEAFAMGRAARAKAQREYTPGRHVARLEPIYEEAARVAAGRGR
jgi:glycosyltransferase involved in cell wall biosynthesis